MCRSFTWTVNVPLRNFDYVLIVAPHMDKSGTASCCKDLVCSEHLFWKQHDTGLHKTSLTTDTKYWNDVKRNLLLLPTIDSKKENRESIMLANNKLCLPLSVVKRFVAFLLTERTGQRLCNRQEVISNLLVDGLICDGGKMWDIRIKVRLIQNQWEGPCRDLNELVCV